ncbi:MAG: XRE family transcriptional regulator [Bdellovibrionales bacterium]
MKKTDSMEMPNRIRELRKARGWTLQQLADATGTTKSQIDKLEKGYRRLTVDWMVRIARPLGRDPRDLMIIGFEAVNFTRKDAERKPARDARLALPPPQDDRARDMPLYDGCMPEKFFSAKPIDFVPRPYYVGHTKDAYALYVDGDAMMPRYRPRQLLFVNPYKLPAQGSGVVVIDRKGTMHLREFVRQTPKGVVLREYQPKDREITMAPSDIAAVHVVAGTVE